MNRYTFSLPLIAIVLACLACSAPASALTYTQTAAAIPYVDACAGGTSSTSPEVKLTLPFNVTFYSVTSPLVAFSRNGQLTTNGSPPGASAFSLALPSSSAPHPALFVFWDDLVYGSTGHLCYQTFGTAPARSFVVEWKNVTFGAIANPTEGAGSILDFEAILYEASTEIDLVYNTMAGTDGSGREAGALATVGMQDDTHTLSTSTHDVAQYGSGTSYTFTLGP